MKKVLFTLALFASLSSFAQKKEEPKDSTVQITLHVNEYRAVLSAIDANIDSKKLSKDLIEFIAKNAQLVTDKPKELPTKKKD